MLEAIDGNPLRTHRVATNELPLQRVTPRSLAATSVLPSSFLSLFEYDFSLHASMLLWSLLAALLCSCVIFLVGLAVIPSSPPSCPESRQNDRPGTGDRDGCQERRLPTGPYAAGAPDLVSLAPPATSLSPSSGFPPTPGGSRSVVGSGP